MYEANWLSHWLRNSPSLYWALRRIHLHWRSHFQDPVSTRIDSEQAAPFLLIVGSGRSGSTLLRRLLMENKDIYIPPETYVLSQIATYRTLAKGLSWPSFVDLVVSAFEYHPEFETFEILSLRDYALEAKNWDVRNQTLPELILGLYKWFAIKKGQDSAWVGDKTPLNTLYLNSIKEVLPHAKYIYVLRDGVDVAASYKSAGLYDNLTDAAHRWIRSQKYWDIFKRKLPQVDFVEIRYEDMVSSPSNTLDIVGERLNIPKRTHSKNVGEILGDVEMRDHHAAVFRDPTKGSIGKGRRTLTEVQKSKLRPILNSTLKKMGYDSI